MRAFHAIRFTSYSLRFIYPSSSALTLMCAPRGRASPAATSIALQMPAGIPVATMGIGKGGSRNAAILAVEILAVKYPALQKKLKSYKQQLARKVAKKNRQVKNINKAQRHRGTEAQS